MVHAFLAVSAVVPSLLAIWYFTSRDVNPEPAKVVWRVFGLGVASVALVLLIVLPTSPLLEAAAEGPILTGLLEAFLQAAIPEELCKLLVVWLYASRHREFDEPMDGIVYGAAASLGFATLENLIYCLSGGQWVAAARAITAVQAHAFWGAIMGYFVGQAWLVSGGERRRRLLAA